MGKSVGRIGLVYLGVRVPKTLKDKLEKMAIEESATVTDIVIQAIRKGLAV